MPSALMPEILSRVSVGLLTISLFGCSGAKAPKTLFITYGIDESNFKDDQPQIQKFFDKNIKAFQRSNPETHLVYITYPSSEITKQISKDSDLNLGPDIVVTDVSLAGNLLNDDLTTILPDKEFFNSIYDPYIQSYSKINGEYSFAPWIRTSQIACFNNTKIKKSPSTIQELENLSASGHKIGLSSTLTELLWTAGANGALEELSIVGKQIKTDQSYPAIKEWLGWLRKAALYQNILFFENSRSLAKDLQNNKLDWIPCWGSQLDELKNTMGSTLSVAALPDGSKSKASPPMLLYGFALGKNSSQSQRESALKFIKTNVNTIAQRKFQLSDQGFFAVNINVSIPPNSSQKINALNTAFNEQNRSYLNTWDGVLLWLGFRRGQAEQENNAIRYLQLQKALTELTNGYLNINETTKIITAQRN